MLDVNILFALHVIHVQITFSGNYLENSTFGLLVLVLLYQLLTWLFSLKGKAGTAYLYGSSVSCNNISWFCHLTIQSFCFQVLEVYFAWNSVFCNLRFKYRKLKWKHTLPVISFFFLFHFPCLIRNWVV